MKTWVKLYTEILNDPDIGSLSLADRGLWSMLLALAGQLDDRDDQDAETGRLDTPERIVWHLRISMADLAPAIARFVELGMVDDRDGVLYLTNYRKRQATPASGRNESVRQRVTRYRNKPQQPATNVTPLHAERNDTVTQLEESRVEESRVDADAETHATTTATAVSPDPDAGAVHTAWQKARGGAVNALDAQQIDDLIADYTPQWVLEAIAEANRSRQDKLPSIRFLDAILQRWKREGFRAPFDPRAQREKSIAQDARKTEEQRTEEALRVWHLQHGIKEEVPA